jgi:hypothetical protein
MAFQSVCEVITALRTWQWQDGWIRMLDKDHICGEGEASCFVFRAALTLLETRSVHNVRIERLWVDFTQGVGRKWREFFEDLEMNDGLDLDLPAHIWLLHWLFLEAINTDISEWVDAWNHHKVSLQGEHDKSPRDMYIFGMLEHGPRGIQHLFNLGDGE